MWFGVALSVVLGIGIAGAIAAGPKPEATTSTAPSGETTAAATTILAPAITAVVTTAPQTTVVATDPPTLVPPTVAAVLMTAEIVDGDTITMSDGSRVRLIGIDTPERGQCGYEESSALLAQLIEGQNITLVTGARDDIDKYGRLLRYVEANGVDLDLKMIQSGRAIARYDGRDGYGVHARQDSYVEADDLSPSSNVCTVVTVTVVPIAVVPFAVVPVSVAPTAAPAPAPPAAVHYQNCTEVRAAGAAPIHAGDPGWQSKFDRDGDGVGCE